MLLPLVDARETCALRCLICLTLQVVALHRERYVFPVTLKVTRVSGTGVDAVFMGVMKVGGPVLLTGPVSGSSCP